MGDNANYSNVDPDPLEFGTFAFLMKFRIRIKWNA
jgi:hypothetical protein